MLAALALLAAIHPVDLPRTFAPVLAEVEDRTEVAVLLPDSMPTEHRKVFPSGDGRRRSWSLSLASRRSCGADACFVASFTASVRGRPFGTRRVKLARGRTGRFRPLSCGASCSPPEISWRERGALYSIQADVGTKNTERRILVRMANSAIRSGPR